VEELEDRVQELEERAAELEKEAPEQQDTISTVINTETNDADKLSSELKQAVSRVMNS